MHKKVAVRERERLFLALPIPSPIRSFVVAVLPHYTPYLERTIPRENWHITLVFLGECEFRTVIAGIARPLTQHFLPTVSLTHLGAGLAPHQLWAYANASTLLTNVRHALLERLASLSIAIPPTEADRPFTPHINLGALARHSGSVGIPDHPLQKTFVASAIHIYRSERTSSHPHYVTEGIIPLTASGL